MNTVKSIVKKSYLPDWSVVDSSFPRYYLARRLLSATSFASQNPYRMHCAVVDPVDGVDSMSLFEKIGLELVNGTDFGKSKYSETPSYGTFFGS